MISRKLIKQQPRRRLITYAAGLGLLVLTFGIAGAALAVHDLDFQLDGNAAATCPPAPDTGFCTSAQEDWADLFTVGGGGGTQTVTKNTPISGASGTFTTATFTRDFRSGSACTTDAALSSTSTTFCTNDTTTYATGSKDTLEINTGWACNNDHNVNSKIDIMNAYSASYTRTSDGHKILYFGLEKNKDNGTNDAGFWFLQGDASCNAPSGGHPSWTGTHTIGDVLVVAEYSTGGGVGNITAYRWDGTTPLVQIANAAVGTADCKVRLAGDDLCGTTNSGAKQFNTNITTPWLTSDATLGVGTTVVPPDFFEGGIDITAAFQESGGTAPTCFNTYIADTRSSTSLTATLFDFARGRLGECSSTTTTTPVDATDNTAAPASSIPVDPADAKVDVKDKTVITVSGVSTFTGSISWHICGPTAASSTQLCDGTTGNVGVDLGSQGITTAGTYYSPTATITSAGRYCFRAEFSGDSSAGVPGSSDSSSGECFTVAPVQPTLTTDATDGPVDFGQPISDVVTLSGTAHKPGTGGPAGDDGSINPTTLGGDATGNIIVKAYGPDDCSALAFTSSAIAASGDGTYGGAGTAFEFTPSAPGQYIFVASYAGDSPNTKDIAATACSAAPNAEKVTVRTIPTEITTGPTWVPNDSATVTSSVALNNLPADGTITFSLYRDAGGNTAAENCALGGSTGREYTKSFLTGAAAHSVTKASDNTKSYSVDLLLYWLVTYDPGDTAHTGIQSQCVEAIDVNVTGDAGPGTAFP